MFTGSHQPSVSTFDSEASSTRTPVSDGLTIRLTMAPAFFGNNIAWMFLGFVFLQSHQYFTYKQRKDTLFLRAFVGSVVLLTIVETVLEGYVGYRYLVGGWGDPQVLLGPPKPLPFQPVVVALMGTLVQCFYAWRIRVFGSTLERPLFAMASRLLSYLITLMSISALASSLAIPIVFVRTDVQAVLLERTRIGTTAWTVISAVCDITITVCMIGILQHAKSKTEFADTRDALSRLIRLSIQTGLLTSIFALGIIVVFLTEQSGNMHTFACYLLGKSYPMSLLANLNARAGSSSPSSNGFSTISFARRGKKKGTNTLGLSTCGTSASSNTDQATTKPDASFNLLRTNQEPADDLTSANSTRKVRRGPNIKEDIASPQPVGVPGELMELGAIVPKQSSIRRNSDRIV